MQGLRLLHHPVLSGTKAYRKEKDMSEDVYDQAAANSHMTWCHLCEAPHRECEPAPDLEDDEEDL